MSGKLAAFWHKAGEMALLLLAFVWPLAFYLQTYDAAAIKTATFQLGVLVMAAAWFLKSVERGRFELPAGAVPLLIPAALLLCSTLFGFLSLEHRAAALPGVVERVLCLAAYSVALLEFGGQDAIERFTAWLLRAAWVAGLYGLCQWGGLDLLPWKGAFGGRVFSTLATPELFASFAIFCVPLSLVRVLDSERGWMAKAADLVLAALLCVDLRQTNAVAAALPRFPGPFWNDAILHLALFGTAAVAAFRARSALREAVYPLGLFGALIGAAIVSPLLPSIWLLWPLAGMLGGFSLLSQPAGPIHVLPLPWGPGRRWLYAPVLAAFVGLGMFPVRWVRSDVDHNLAIHHSKQKNWQEALAHYERVAPGSPAYVSSRYLMGLVYMRMGKPEEAQREYALVESLTPDYRRLSYQRGLAYAKAFDWEKALASHEKQAALDPLDAENLRALAQAATVRGELDRAALAARRAIALKPAEPANWQALSSVYLKEKKTVAARRILSEGRRLGLKFDKPGSNR